MNRKRKDQNCYGIERKIIKDEDGSRIIVRCTLYSREEEKRRNK
jgi:hypothetical protein